MSRVPRAALVRFLVLLSAVAASGLASAQRAAFTVDQVLSFPFPSELVAAPRGAAIAWAGFERGFRSIYVAEGPTFTPRRLTNHQPDDGQELTSVSWSADGRYVVYVRGGDHGSNWPAEGNLMPDPASSPVQPRVEIWAAPVMGGEPKVLAEGDSPDISPAGDRIAYVQNRQMWSVPIAGDRPAARLFFARGESAAPTWSPDGRTLAFVSDRDDHRFVGLYTSADRPIRYLAASTARDSSPRWSPDGTRIAFVRQPGRGGPVQPLLTVPTNPWAIWVADVATGDARQVWRSPETRRGSFPQVMGGANLQWAAGDRLVFLSYQDGWPHLYSLSTTPSTAAPEPTLLTPGNFMVEYVTLTPDRQWVIYNANTGSDGDDIERRHLFKVAVDKPGSTPVTSGRGIEWAPVVTGDGRLLAYVASDAQRPPQVTVMAMDGTRESGRAITSDHVPRDFPSAQLVTPEHVTFNAADGTVVHGQLFRMKDGSPKRPGIVFVHGGPPRQMLVGWHYMFYYANTYGINQYLASRGFIVLSVNYRLGIGYGHGFHAAERAGARGASEYQDVLAAGKYLQARADVDAQRVGIYGGSYGGYLTALALGRNSDVFAGGVDIHGVHSRLPGVPNELMVSAAVGDGITDADLREALRVAWESSPIAAVPTWKSPVLFIHGDDDRNVRFSQTVDLERRLAAKGVRYEEIVTPDDIHDFLLHRNWVTVGKAVADFFDCLFKTTSPSQHGQPECLF